MREEDCAWLAVLREYRRDNFNCLPAPSTVYCGGNLGEWLVAARRAALAGTIDGELAAALDRTDPAWRRGQHQVRRRVAMVARDRVWDAKYSLLNDFVQAKGRLPTVKESYNGCNIGFWIDRQRQEYCRGSLPQKRHDALVAIPIWRWVSETVDTEWQSNYLLLEQFVGEHGRRPGVRDVYRGVNLGLWVSNQRRARNQRDYHKMTPERASQLEKIPGWTWDCHDATWWTKLEALRGFVEEHRRLPAHHEMRAGVYVGWWAQRQRCAASRRKLSPEREAALNGIRGWTW